MRFSILEVFALVVAVFAYIVPINANSMLVKLMRGDNEHNYWLIVAVTEFCILVLALFTKYMHFLGLIVICLMFCIIVLLLCAPITTDSMIMKFTKKIKEPTVWLIVIALGFYFAVSPVGQTIHELALKWIEMLAR